MKKIVPVIYLIFAVFLSSNSFCLTPVLTSNHMDRSDRKEKMLLAADDTFSGTLSFRTKDLLDIFDELSGVTTDLTELYAVDNSIEGSVTGQDTSDVLLDHEVFWKIDREILRILNSPEPAEELKKFFIFIKDHTEYGVSAIPSVYKLLKNRFTSEQLRLLGRVTFELFTGMSPEEFAEKTESMEKSSFPVTSPADQKEPAIFTLTPNVAIDFSGDIESLLEGAENGDSYIIDGGGKAVNISRGLHRWGIKTTVCGFTHGVTGRIYRNYLEKKQAIDCGNMLYSEEGNTRINLGIHTGGKGQVYLSMTGPYVSQKDIDTMESFIISNMSRGDFILMSGTLPAGVEKKYYGDLVRKLKSRGIKTFVDARSEQLKYAIEAVPYLVGINEQELAEYLDLDASVFQRHPEKIVSYIEGLVNSGIEIVLITVGPKGILMGTKEGVFWARPPVEKEVSTTGAGDTVKVAFSYVLAKHGSALDALRLGAAASSITVTKPGTGISSLKEAESRSEKVIIRKIKSASLNDTEEHIIRQAVNVVHGNKIEVIFARQFKVDTLLKKKIAKINQKYGDIITISRCKDVRDLVDILSDGKADTSRIIVSDIELAGSIKKFLIDAEATGLFRDVKIITVDKPEAFINEKYKTAFYSKLLMVAMFARIFDRKPTEVNGGIKALLEEFLDENFNSDMKKIKGFINSLSKEEGKDTSLEEIKQRVLFFIKPVNVIKLTDVLEKEIVIMKKFWFYA